MLICGQFIAKDLNLWSTLLFVSFEKLTFSDFWCPLNLLGPSKKSQLLDSWSLSMHQKTRPWINLFKNIVLYLLYQAPSDLLHHYGNGVFGNGYLLALDNTKRQTLPAPHCRNGVVDHLGPSTIKSWSLEDIKRLSFDAWDLKKYNWLNTMQNYITKVK